MADHEVQEVSFKPATGGMISETRRKMAGDGKFGPEWKTETAVHANLGHAIRHLKSTMEGGNKGMKKKEKSMKRGSEPSSMKARTY